MSDKKHYYTHDAVFAELRIMARAHINDLYRIHELLEARNPGEALDYIEKRLLEFDAGWGVSESQISA